MSSLGGAFSRLRETQQQKKETIENIQGRITRSMSSPSLQLRISTDKTVGRKRSQDQSQSSWLNRPPSPSSFILPPAPQLKHSHSSPSNPSPSPTHTSSPSSYTPSSTPSSASSATSLQTLVSPESGDGPLGDLYLDLYDLSLDQLADKYYDRWEGGKVVG